MTRIDWNRANRIEQARQAERRRAQARASGISAERQNAMREFVSKHRLVCFTCKRVREPWAKTGWTKNGRPWAVCLKCVRERPADKRPSD
jgi:hypothetical protein